MGNIPEVVISRDHRGKGIGKSLLSSAEEWLKKQIIYKISREVTRENTISQVFWENNGYFRYLDISVKKLGAE